MPALSPSQIAHLVALRHSLHAAPELSGAEVATAQSLAGFLRPTGPARILDRLGGTGLAIVYDSGRKGPRVMFRAELDALPIPEDTGRAHGSRVPGVAHLCGHDGHMAILAGLGLWLARNPPAYGQVVLLFQPAEEIGTGARAVMADPRFAQIRPDWAFALHNMPGLPIGSVAVAPGAASCASLGLRICLTGRAAHAAQPETGQAPTPAVAALLAALAPYSRPAPMGPGFALATLCHLNLGQPAFGIAPASAEAWITLRGYDDATLARLEAEITRNLLAAAQGLHCTITRQDHFQASMNDPEAAAIVRAAQSRLGRPAAAFDLPMRPSEDFGAFGAAARAALFFLGAGQAHPALHDPGYDFPDVLIEHGVDLFAAIAQDMLAARLPLPGATRPDG